MKKPATRRWNWPSALLLLFMMQTASARLVITQWTDYLFFTQTLAVLGLALGLSLGYSHFKRRTVILLSIGYSLVLIPWQLTLAIEDALLSRRLASVGGRLFFAAAQFFQREPVADSLLFVAFISIVVWVISLVSGYWWSRHENYLAAVLPGGIFTLVIHLYDQFFGSRIWLLAFYLFFAMLLLGQLYLIRNRESWRERRVFQMQESTFDFTRGMIISASLFIVVAWSIPATRSGFDSAVRIWNRVTDPWDDVQEWFSNAIDSLEAPVVISSGEFFSNQLSLGLGNPLTEGVVFSVRAPDLEEKPPRYYWRGYAYDLYQNNSWYATKFISDEFTPSSAELVVPEADEQFTAEFTIRTQISQSLLYVATQPLWVSRPGEVEYAVTGSGEQDVLAWRADPVLMPGEQFQMTAAYTNPSVQQLQSAGTDYPDWVTDRYLQLPEDFSPRIAELAAQVTQGLETPYEKATAITNYLRSEIAYTNPLPEAPPEGADPLEWILFDAKVGFCNYYATLEVLMLRSLGVPARMAGGFAQGAFDSEANVYIVRSLDAHAWPEVYFSDYGWIEFEPTGNQDPLLRPNRPEDIDPESLEDPTEDNLNPSGLDPTGDSDIPPGFEEGFGDTAFQTPEEQRAAAFQRFLFPILGVIFIGLVWFFNRRYAVFDQIPTRLQTAYERNGGRSPNWLSNWAHWTRLTAIERAFETINRSLRLLGKSPAFHATPAERANLLVKELPTASQAIESLLEQHQASLFTPEPGRAGEARRASLTIWWHAGRAILQKLLYGRRIEP